MWSPNCKTEACRYCHPIPWQDTRLAPSYMHFTKSARSRNTETRQEHQILAHQCPPKNNPKAPAAGDQTKDAGSRFGFLKLPLEVRRVIYQYSFDLPPIDPSRPKYSPGIAMCGHVQGGAFHAGAPRNPSKLNILAARAPNASLLRVSRQIYAEALDEAYRGIPLQLLDCSSSDIHSGRMKYWLRQHPFRYTRELTFDCGNLLVRSAFRTANKHFLDFDRSAAVLLTGLLNGMRNLRAVTFQVDLAMGQQISMTQLYHFIRWIRSTASVAVSLREAIKVEIKVQLDICQDKQVNEILQNTLMKLRNHKKAGEWFARVELGHHPHRERCRSRLVRLERRTGPQRTTDVVGDLK